MKVLIKDNTQTPHNAENERLKKQLDIAMKALLHYADAENWMEHFDMSGYAEHEEFKPLYRGYKVNGCTVAQQAIEDVEKVK